MYAKMGIKVCCVITFFIFFPTVTQQSDNVNLVFQKEVRRVPSKIHYGRRVNGA